MARAARSPVDGGCGSHAGSRTPSVHSSFSVVPQVEAFGEVVEAPRIEGESNREKRNKYMVEKEGK